MMLSIFHVLIGHSQIFFGEILFKYFAHSLVGGIQVSFNTSRAIETTIIVTPKTEALCLPLHQPLHFGVG